MVRAISHKNLPRTDERGRSDFPDGEALSFSALSGTYPGRSPIPAAISLAIRVSTCRAGIATYLNRVLAYCDRASKEFGPGSAGKR